MITTRKGSEGLPKVTFSASIGINNVTRLPKVLNREEFMDYIETSYTNGYLKRTYPNSGQPEVPLDILIAEYATVEHAVTEYNTGVYTNWYDEVIRKNVINQSYNLQLVEGPNMHTTWPVQVT